MTKPIKSLKTPAQLIHAGLIDANHLNQIDEVARRYAIAIPQTIAARIDPNDESDPLKAQFIPSPEELNRLPHEQDDPIGDNLKSPVPGIVHRYPDRALLKLVSVCPIYCRFCFRRESVGPAAGQSTGTHATGTLSQEQLDAALKYVKEHREIWELIITGGDPLVLSPRRIHALNTQIAQIPHVKIIRWHTRVPVILPHHITPALCDALKCKGKTVYIGLHTNHAKEFSNDAEAACARLIDAGHTMVSQTVLLKGINDDAATMIALMRKLVENRIKPYYLHHTDLAPGTSHFRVSIETGQAIVREMRAKLSGLAQPTYVLDIPGAHGKVPIGPNYITPKTQCADTGHYSVTTPNGTATTYADAK